SLLAQAFNRHSISSAFERSLPGRARLFPACRNRSFPEKLIEEQNLVVNGIIPILPGMPARTSDKIMVYLSRQQSVMQILIHIQEEIRLAAIKDNRQISIFNLINLVNDRMLIPHFLVPGKFSQLFRHF